MRRSTRLGMVSVLLAGMPVLAPHLAGQGRAADQREPAYASRATAVLVDAVVRDRQGRPLLDLAPTDFELYEDGVRQEIGSFTLVQRGAGIGIDVRLKDRSQSPTTVVTPTGAPGGEDAERLDPPTIAFVFDALSPESLSLCQQAALQSIRMQGDLDARVGIFMTEPVVRAVQRYTTDPALVRAALLQVSPTSGGGKDTRDEHLETLRRQMNDMDARGLLSTNVGGGQGSQAANASGQVGQAEQQRRLIEGEMRMLQAFDTLDRDHRGYGTTSSLLVVLESLAYVAGRKSVVFFSQGLPASPALQGQLQSVIESANRANITVYAVDATGLRVLSPLTETRREVQAAAEERLRQAGNSRDVTEGPLTKMLERTEDVMRFDSQGGLARLAEDTGGFLVRDTNNIASAFKRIDEDIRFHYMLTYSPVNDVLDGKFRTITVKVKRPNTTVYARKGYRAIRTPGALPVFTYEAPALVMLDANPLPNAFPSRAGAFVFPEKDRPGLTPIVVRVGTEALRFQVDDKRSTYSAQAAVVVRIRDGAGQVIQKFSQQYVLSGDAKDVEGAKRGEILFYREAELRPGAYQMESLVYDAQAEKGSGRVSSIDVPGPEAPRLKMSSVMLIDHSEQTPGRPKPSEKEPPFYFGDTLLYPNLGEPLIRGRQDELPFYFVVYQVPGRCACTARIALLKNGQPLADATRTLTPQTDLRLQHVGKLPVGDLPSGTYELRVTVSDGVEQQSRNAFFTVG